MSDNPQYEINKQKAIDHVMLLYGKQSYFNIYGPNVIYFSFMIIVLVLVICFANVMMKIKPIRENWDVYKCKPEVIPFAGLINLPNGSTILEYTSENFEYCMHNILTSITGYELEPLNFITSTITEAVSAISEVFQAIRTLIAEIRTNIGNVIGTISSKIINVIIPFQKIIIKLQDSLAKSQAILTTGLYTVFGIFFSVKSLFGAMVQIMITILIALAIAIFLFIVFFMYPASIPLTVIFTAVSIPLAIIIAFLTDVMGIQVIGGIPKIQTSKCFDKNTKLTLQNGTEVNISDIHIGDILRDGSVIQSHLVLERGNENMYNLNGVIVSGTHILLYKNKWIFVADYPHIQKLSDYNETLLYCVVTSTKTITLNNIVFSDWDEVLVKNKYLKLLKNININTKYAKLEQIHCYYDKGFPSDTLIELKNGTIKQIAEINIGDELNTPLSAQNQDSIYVYGKVFIRSDDLVYGNLLDNTTKRTNTKYLGGFYHLLTNQEYFYVNSYKYFDYNSCIDLYVNYPHYNENDDIYNKYCI